MYLKSVIFLFIPCVICASDNTFISNFNMPEIYQDILIRDSVVKKGIRDCEGRYDAICDILKCLPLNFKVLDLGAAQGYFSFRMAKEFDARCVLVENTYSLTNFQWDTIRLLKFLCEQNSHLKNLSLLKKCFFCEDLILLSQLEKFDLVVAFSVIHHMRKDENDLGGYEGIIDAILKLAPMVIIENPVNTGEHTLIIRKLLQKKKGKLIYTSFRENLIYEIYLFYSSSWSSQGHLDNLKKETYEIFNGIYTNINYFS